MKFTNNPRLGVPLMVLAALLSSVLVVLALILSKNTGWQMVAFCRSLFGFLIGLFVLTLMKEPFFLKLPPEIWFRSIGGSVALLLNFYAFQRLSAAESSLFCATAPLWLVGFYFFRSKERLQIRLMTGFLILVAILGILLSQKNLLFAGNYGGLAALGASLIVAFILLFMNRIVTVHPLVIAAHHSFVTAIVSGSLILLTVTPKMPDADFLGGVFLLAFVAIIAQMLTVKAFQIGKNNSVAASSNATILFSGAYDLFSHGRMPATWNPISFLAVGVPVLIIALRKKFQPINLEGYSEKEAKQLEVMIAHAETKTSCEFRLAIEQKEIDNVALQAERIFHVNGMTNTKRRNAILVYICNSGSTVIADIGIQELVPKEELALIINKVITILGESHGIASVRDALNVLSSSLKKRFPHEDDENELPDHLLSIETGIGQ